MVERVAERRAEGYTRSYANSLGNKLPDTQRQSAVQTGTDDLPAHESLSQACSPVGRMRLMTTTMAIHRLEMREAPHFQVENAGLEGLNIRVSLIQVAFPRGGPTIEKLRQIGDGKFGYMERVMKPGVFLDRDGVIIEDSPNYITHREDIRLLPDAAAAIRALNESGIPVVVVTNQSAVARGMITEAELQGLNQRVAELLAQTDGAKWDRLYYCPYHPDGAVPEYKRESDLRKPQPGMLLRASRELGLDLPGSFMIGDKGSDILAGERAGCHTILVLTGPDSGSWQRHPDCRPDFTARDLGEAVRWILSQIHARS